MKKVLFLSCSVILFSCGGGNKNETKQNDSKTTTQTETPTETKTSSVETPLSGVIKEVKKTEHGIDVLVKVECVVDEKTVPNYLFTKLVDDDGLECGSELMGSPKPEFSFKEMYKGDKSSGWLSFKFPNSNFIPKKIVFNKIMGGKLCEIMIPNK
jgi:hypothetical protein